MNGNLGTQRFPESAALFHFCRAILGIRRAGARIMDQDVGGLLDLDPADCSHWKNGKKQIHSVQAVQSIAAQLQCDDSLVAAVATGMVDDVEAVFEAKGFGAFAVDTRKLENTFNEMRRVHLGQWSREREDAIRAGCMIDRLAIESTVAAIHEKIGCSEAPVFLPEIARALPVMEFRNIPAGRESRPHYRFEMARQAGAVLRAQPTCSVQSYRSQGRSSLPSHLHDHVREVEENLFALELLAPMRLVRAEIARAAIGRDLIKHLSEVFWLPRSIMNRRIKDLISSPVG